MERVPSGPCHVPASAPRSRRQIRGRCAGRQAGGQAGKGRGKKRGGGETTHRRGDKSEWRAADGASVHIKQVLIKRAACRVNNRGTKQVILGLRGRLALSGRQLDQKSAPSVIAYQSKPRFIQWLVKERQIRRQSGETRPPLASAEPEVGLSVTLSLNLEVS